jgi:plasmid stabilization system protein ParE
MRLEVSLDAERDIAALHLYGTIQYGEKQADLYVMDLLDELRRIAEWPLAHAERAEVRPAIHLRPWRAHNVFYDVEDSVVTIVRVLHHSADWMHEL